MIQRYGLFGAYDDWKMQPDSDGEFVLFSDHVAEVERLRADKAALGQAVQVVCATAKAEVDRITAVLQTIANGQHDRPAVEFARAALAHPIADVERVAQGD